MPPAAASETSPKSPSRGISSLKPLPSLPERRLWWDLAPAIELSCQCSASFLYVVSTPSISERDLRDVATRAMNVEPKGHLRFGQGAEDGVGDLLSNVQTVQEVGQKGRRYRGGLGHEAVARTLQTVLSGHARRSCQIKPDCGRKKSENSARLASPPLSANGKARGQACCSKSPTPRPSTDRKGPSRSALNTPARLPRMGVIEQRFDEQSRSGIEAPQQASARRCAVRDSSVGKAGARLLACDSAS